MKWIRLFSVVLLLFCLSGPRLVSQEEKKTSAKETTYDSAGRRDPFKNLLGGKEVSEKTAIEGLTDLYIEDIQLIGIIQSKGKLEAIVSIIKGLPLTLKEGDKLADGYVLSIQETQVTFRKLSDKGIPLMRPRDVIREISFEER
ncbi:MAG: hypothetical protein WCC06_10820 [Candidatus Aminicenantales bacterium]